MEKVTYYKMWVKNIKLKREENSKRTVNDICVKIEMLLITADIICTKE